MEKIHTSSELKTTLFRRCETKLRSFFQRWWVLIVTVLPLSRAAVFQHRENLMWNLCGSRDMRWEILIFFFFWSFSYIDKCWLTLCFHFAQDWSNFSRCRLLHSQRAGGYDQEFVACCIMFSTSRACVGKNKDLAADKRALLIIKKISGWRWCFDHHCENVISKVWCD